MEGVTAVNGGELIGINTNLGDKVSHLYIYRKNTTLTKLSTGHLQEQLLPQDPVPGLQGLRQV
jgi:hypothetical protein